MSRFSNVEICEKPLIPVFSSDATINHGFVIVSAIEKTGFTDRQREFINHIGRGYPVEAAAEKSGYCREVGYQLVRQPRIAAAIHFEVQRLLATHDAPLARRTLLKILVDESAPPRTRADIGIKLLSMAGHGFREGQKGEQDKPLASMSPDELHRLIERNQAEIERIEKELAGHAKDVSAPQGPLIDAKPLNYMD